MKASNNHFHQGLTHAAHKQFELAVIHYHQAIATNLNDDLVWNNLGVALENLNDLCNAKIAYTTAITLNPKQIEAHNNLGAIYSEEGDLGKAAQLFEKAINLNPEFISAHYNLSLIKTYTVNDQHLNYLKSIIKNIPLLSSPMQIRYYFAFGKALKDIKEYALAFRAYASGNALHYKENPWDKTKLENFVEISSEIFTRDFLKSSQLSNKKCCPIFIVGMPRSGTTLIEQILAGHEEVYGAGELNILDQIIENARAKANLPFKNWLKQLSDHDFLALGEHYLNIVRKFAPNKNYIIDKMPANCFYIGMIYRMLPNAKIIHAIREPMDSCFSCFTHLFKDKIPFTFDLDALGIYYSLYAKMMAHWNEVLNPQVIFHLPYEQMIENHEAMIKELLRYLGLPWDERCLEFYNNKRSIKTASFVEARKPIYKTSINQWLHFEKELAPLMKIVAPYRNRKGISI